MCSSGRPPRRYSPVCPRVRSRSSFRWRSGLGPLPPSDAAQRRGGCLERRGLGSNTPDPRGRFSRTSRAIVDCRDRHSRGRDAPIVSGARQRYSGGRRTDLPGRTTLPSPAGRPPLSWTGEDAGCTAGGSRQGSLAGRAAHRRQAVNASHADTAGDSGHPPPALQPVGRHGAGGGAGAAGGRLIVAFSATRGATGILMRPRVGRSRSNVTRTRKETTTAARMTGRSPRPRTLT